MQEIRRSGYLLILIFAAALSVSHFWKPAARPRYHGLAAAAVPMVIAGYQGAPAPVDAVTFNALSTAQIISRAYTDSSGQSIGVMLIGGTNRDSVHDPRSCLQGSGGSINDDHIETLAAAPKGASRKAGAVLGTGGIPVRACLVTYPPGSQYGTGYDILYFYVSRRKVIASATEIRLLLLRALVEQNSDPVTFVRIAAPYAPGEGYAAEHARLVKFAAEFWKDSAPALLQG